MIMCDSMILHIILSYSYLLTCRMLIHTYFKILNWQMFLLNVIYLYMRVLLYDHDFTLRNIRKLKLVQILSWLFAFNQSHHVTWCYNLWTKNPLKMHVKTCCFLLFWGSYLSFVIKILIISIMSHRQRGHLETAHPFTVPFEDVKFGLNTSRIP